MAQGEGRALAGEVGTGGPHAARPLTCSLPLQCGKEYGSTAMQGTGPEGEFCSEFSKYLISQERQIIMKELKHHESQIGTVEGPGAKNWETGPRNPGGGFLKRRA